MRALRIETPDSYRWVSAAGCQGLLGFLLNLVLLLPVAQGRHELADGLSNVHERHDEASTEMWCERLNVQTHPLVRGPHLLTSSFRSMAMLRRTLY